MRGTLLNYYHDHRTAGHLGVTKTLARLRLRFFWPKMAGGVKKNVTSCSVCQLTKPSQRKLAWLMVPILPQKPWEYTGVDFVGPLPRTSAGNVYLLVFVDYFSKWIGVLQSGKQQHKWQLESLSVKYSPDTVPRPILSLIEGHHL